jgi:2-iminobutanoate/2-iminopropanoate deaminase
MKSRSVMIAAILTCLTVIAGPATAQERLYINGNSAASGKGSPFSGAVLTGDTLYISGMLGLANGQVPEDPRDEARNMLNAVKAALEAAGMTMDDLVQVTVYTTDLAHYAAFNEVYRTYFTREFPARAFVGAGSLLANARFEMQSIAVKR